MVCIWLQGWFNHRSNFGDAGESFEAVIGDAQEAQECVAGALVDQEAAFAADAFLTLLDAFSAINVR